MYRIKRRRVIDKVKALFGRALIPRKWKNEEDHENGFGSTFQQIVSL
jgi:hypothetical protein